MLKQQLRDELKQSMISRDTLRTSVLRMLISAITYYEINKGGAGYEATDEDVLSVIQTQVKQRKDSIEQFENAKRQELADKEKEELQFLTKYLPQQLTEDEVKNLVKEAIMATGATNPQDMGKVMAYLMPNVKGKADGGMVSRLVKALLLT